MDLRLKELPPRGVKQIQVSVPLKPEGAVERCPRFVELIKTFDPLRIRVQHPDTAAVVFEFEHHQGTVNLDIRMIDDELAWPGPGGGPVRWSSADSVLVDVIVDSTVVPYEFNL